jgi:hypothetical protein
MATTRAEPTTYAEQFDEKYPSWVYSIPGFLLMVGGFGGLAAMSLF